MRTEQGTVPPDDHLKNLPGSEQRQWKEAKLQFGDDGIDCRYCHTSVETSASAGMPPTQTCMNCHSQIWADSPYLEPIRASFRDNKPIEWVVVQK